MDVDKAIEQISEIHKHLARSEIFYGYKPIAVAAVGCVAILVAVIQSWVIVPINEKMFLLQWMIVAAVITIIMCGNIIYNYLKYGSDFEIHQMSKVFIQFIPSLVGGLIITFIFFTLEDVAVKFLPGIWAILFGLGVFSMRPYLPRMISFLTLYYFIAAAVLLYIVNNGSL